MNILNNLTYITNSFWFEAVLRLTLGCVLAGIIGLERSSWSKPAGFRTHALVGLSSVLIMLCGEYMTKIYDMDPSRIPAQLLSGIGFIGAGTILRDGFNVKGLTTAACLLTVTCIGLSIGAGFYLGGIMATLVAYLLLSYSYKVYDNLDRFENIELDIRIGKETEKTLENIEKILTDYNVEIKNIKRPNEDGTEGVGEKIKIIGEYNKKGFKKNEVLRSITSLKNVKEVLEQ